MSKAIGEVACDRKNCDGMCDVFKFGGDAEGKRGSPFKGRMWMKCRKCGYVIGREGSQAVTDYILENGKIWAKENDGESSESGKVSTSPNRQETKPPQPAQVPKKPASQPTRPAQSKEPKQPAQEPAKPARKWWEWE